MKTVDMPVSFFEKNRLQLSLKLKNNSIAIFQSNDEMNRSFDQNFPYRQDSDLFYLSGINQEKTMMILAPDYPDASLREVLFIIKPDRKLETWEGHKLTPEEAASVSGIKNIRYLDEFEAILAPLMMFAENVYVNVPELSKQIPELPGRNLRFANEIKNKFPAHHYERIAPVMRELRIIKSTDETRLIREACRITHNAFSRALKRISPGIMEYEVEAEITYEFIREGARGHAYQPIIASGINACTLHYINNNKPCEEGDLLLMDFGAEYGNYSADCTRTVPVNGRFTHRQKEMYKSVLEVFRFASSLIKPGNTINQLHAEVCKRFGDEHVRLGLYSAEELKNQNKDNPLYLQYYLHGTSHFLGLDVHDLGQKDTEFRPGMVLTCEPGIYVPSEKTGIRLENDILITKDGNEDLMKDIPIDIEEIEQMMGR